MKNYQEIKEEISSLPAQCHNCNGTDKKYYGECKCSYSEKQLIDKEKVLEILNEITDEIQKERERIYAYIEEELLGVDDELLKRLANIIFNKTIKL